MHSRSIIKYIQLLISRSQANEKGLGCCEYKNRKGDRAHILLTSCCDCEAIDATCDRCLRCLPVPRGLIAEVWATLADRLRVPWVGGALSCWSRSSASLIRLQCDAVAPIFIIPTLLVLATTSEMATLAVCFFTPICLLLLYRCWREQHGRPRTRFFFSWALVSSFCMAYVFLMGVICTRLVHLWEGMVVLLGMIFMFYFLFLAKQDPGILRSHLVPKQRYYSNSNYYGPRQVQKPPRDTTYVQYPKSLPAFGVGYGAGEPLATNAMMMMNGAVGGEKSGPGSAGCPYPEMATLSETMTLPRRTRTVSENMPEQEIVWIDSRKVQAGHLSTYCQTCCVKQPKRASHCNVCNQCIEERDHHCIWIDQCIGKRNHKWFLLALVTMIFTSTYALHLSLTTICTPEMVYDWILYPRDCRFVYSDFLHAVSFVSCCYTMTSLMLLFAVLLQQLVLISQNVTLTEFNMAAKRRWVSHFGLFAHHNLYNHGSLALHWKLFWTGQRHISREEYGRNRHRRSNTRRPRP